MAANDKLLVDGILDEYLKTGRALDRGDAFELFALEQLLKNHDLTSDEIEEGWVDGRDDGGIDGMYLFVNGLLANDPSDIMWPRVGADLQVMVISCKHHETFAQAPLDNLVSTITEFLDFAKADNELSGAYSGDLIRLRGVLMSIYRRLSIQSPSISFRIVYASRGDEQRIGGSVAARAAQVKNVVQSLFSACSVEFEFVGPTKLVALNRSSKRARLELPFIEHFSPEHSSHVVLVTFDSYRAFICDENGELRRYLFDSNVRDYLGPTRVNKDILTTLQDSSAPPFWWLNNGVTILATVANPVGKLLVLEDVQIVNGLQTTESLCRYWTTAAGVNGMATRALIVKVIVSIDNVVRDQIIRATNNQNIVELAALRATDKVQRDIEDALERANWYYERRKNYYKNIGKPVGRFVTPLFLAASYVALAMKNPALGARVKQRALHSDAKYTRLFSEDTPLPVWVAIVEIVKHVEGPLSLLRPSRHGERFIANNRGLISLICVARIRGGFDYSQNDLVELDVGQITDEMIRQCFEIVVSVQPAPERKDYKSMRFVETCCAVAASRYLLRAPQAVGKQKLPMMLDLVDPPTDEELARIEAHIPQGPWPAGLHQSIAHATGLKVEVVSIGLSEFARRSRSRRLGRGSLVIVSEEVLKLVDSALPEQPWQPKVHLEIARALALSPKIVSAAISELMRSGRRHRQKDGVVYDATGAIIGVDRLRHSSEQAGEPE